RRKSPSVRESSPTIIIPDSRMCCTSSNAERPFSAGRKERSLSGRPRSSSMTPSRVNFQASRASSRSVVLVAILPPSLFPARGRSELQVFEPVEDEVELPRRRLGGLVFGDEEALPFGSDVPAVVIPLEERFRARCGERRRCRHRHALELPVFPVEELPAVRRP